MTVIDCVAASHCTTLLLLNSEEEWKKMLELLAQPSPPQAAKLLFKVIRSEPLLIGCMSPTLVACAA